MFNVDDILVYKGHGLVKVTGIPKKRFGDLQEAYYMLRSARSPLSQTKLMVKVQGGEGVLRLPIGEQEAQEIIELLVTEADDLPEEPRERMQIIDEVLQKNEVRESAALVRDYRESKLFNIERPEVKKVKAISRNLAEELCYVLKINRASLRGKLFVKPAG